MVGVYKEECLMNSEFDEMLLSQIHETFNDGGLSVAKSAT